MEIKEISQSMSDLVKFINTPENDEDKKERIVVANEFVLDTLFALKTKHIIIIAFSIIFKRYDFEHIKREK